VVAAGRGSAKKRRSWWARLVGVPICRIYGSGPHAVSGLRWLLNVASASSTSLPLTRDLRLSAHRRSARPKGLDRTPGPSCAHAPAARASSPLGDFARRDPDCCCLVGERKWLALAPARVAKSTGRRKRSGGFVIYNEDQTPSAGTGLFPVLYCFFSETPPTARPLRDAPPVAGLRRESERYGSRPSKLELQKLWAIQQDRSCREWDCPVRLL